MLATRCLQSILQQLNTSSYIINNSPMRQADALNCLCYGRPHSFSLALSIYLSVCLYFSHHHSEMACHVLPLPNTSLAKYLFVWCDLCFISWLQSTMVLLPLNPNLLVVLTALKKFLRLIKIFKYQTLLQKLSNK